MKPCKKLIFAALAMTMGFQSLAAPQPLDRVAVQVNDGIVLESEIQNMMDTVKKNALAAGQTLPSDDALRTQVIERLILTRLQLQMAERVGLHIGDLQLDQAIENIAREQKMTVAQMQQAIQA